MSWVTPGLIGGAGAATAAWLLGQRDDVGTVLILAVVFALGVGVAIEPPRASRPRIRAALGGSIVMGAVRLTGSEALLLVVVAVVAVGVDFTPALSGVFTNLTTKITAAAG